MNNLSTNGRLIAITPDMANDWLRRNKHNRPLRKHLVQRLQEEIEGNHWRMNGQTISFDEHGNILDGQHRLTAIARANRTVDSYVVHGVPRESYATIDTGATRSGADSIAHEFDGYPLRIVKAVSTAVQWAMLMERGRLRGGSRLPNADIVEYLRSCPSLFARAGHLNAYHSMFAVVPLGVGTALYEIFARRSEDMAAQFMCNLYSGENLQHNQVEFLLRAKFLKDAQRISAKLPSTVKARMCIKAWNWLRQGNTTASYHVITVQGSEDPVIEIL